MSIVDTGISLYNRLLKILKFLQCPFLLFVRVYWGWQFWQSGWGKLQDISKPIGFFTELGIPFPVFNAWFVSLLECVGGILLILGLASRLISIPLVIDMAVAYMTADREALKAILSEPDKFYAAAPFTFLFASLVVLLFGPGAVSLDYLIARFIRKRYPVGPASAQISRKV